MYVATPLERAVVSDLALAIEDLIDEGPEGSQVRDEDGEPVGEEFYDDTLEGQEGNVFLVRLASGKVLEVTVVEK
jgi:hypothetical protein